MIIQKRFLAFLLLFCFILVSIFFVGGCSNANSSGVSSAGSSKSSTGNVAFSFSWPAHGKYIPSDTSTIRISISGEGLSGAQVTTVNYGTTSVTVSNLPLGNKTAQISSLDSIGNILTTSKRTFIIQAGKTVSSSATLGALFTNTGFTPTLVTLTPNTWLFFYNDDTQSHNLILSSPSTVYTVPPSSSQGIYFTSSGSYTVYLDSISGYSMTVTVQASAPQITSISPSSGDVGTSVTITGVNFGSSQGSSTVTFNGVLATSITSWSSTQIVCTVPSGATSGNVFIVVGGTSSNGVTFTITAGGSAQWSWSHPSPQGNDIIEISGPVSNDANMIDPRGSIYHYDGSAWTLVSSSTTSGFLNAAWITGTGEALRAFGVGDSGAIYYYNGSTWSSMTSGTSNRLRDVWGTTISNVYAVGDGGVILKYDGSSWSIVNTVAGTQLFGVWGNSANDIYVVGGGGKIVHYNGSSWAEETSPTAYTLIEVSGSSSSNVFACGSNGAIIRYNGIGWSTVRSGSQPLGDQYAVVTSASNNAYTFGINGEIWYYNGSTVSQVDSGISYGAFYAAYLFTSNSIFTAGAYGTVSYYNGTSWSIKSTRAIAAEISGNTTQVRDIWGSSSSNVFAVGELGKISNYNGTSWSAMTSGTPYPLQGVWGTSSSNVFAVGENGTILRYNGTSWSAMTSGTSNYLYDIWGSSSNDVFAVGASGTILRYNGTSWSSMTSGTSSTLYGVWGSSSNDVFAVGASGTVVHYDGTSWSSMTSGTSSLLRSVWGSSSNNVFALTWTGGIVLKYNGSSWSSTTIGTSEYTNAIWGTASDNVYVAANNGKIYNYNGTSWSLVDFGSIRPSTSFSGIWGASATDIFAGGSFWGIVRYGN